MRLFIVRKNGEKLELNDDLEATAADGTELWVEGIARDLLGGEILAGEEFQVLRPDGTRETEDVDIVEEP